MKTLRTINNVMDHRGIGRFVLCVNLGVLLMSLTFIILGYTFLFMFGKTGSIIDMIHRFDWGLVVTVLILAAYRIFAVKS